MPILIIKIVAKRGGKVAFKPNLPNAQEGDALAVEAGDNITWNNTTDDRHVIEVLTQPMFRTRVIRPDDVSNPLFNVSDPRFKVWETVEYRCNDHPEVKGTIEVR